MKRWVISTAWLMILLVVAGCSGADTVEESAELETPQVDESEPKGEVDEAEREVVEEVEPSGIPIEERIDEVVADLERGEEYVVLYSQDGQYRPIEDGRVVLEPRPFQTHVVTTEDVAAMVHISNDPAAKRAVEQGREHHEMLGAPATGMAEHPHNEKRRVMLDEYGSNIWGYSGEATHHFSEVEVRGEVMIGHRTVERVWDTEQDVTTELTDAAGLELYFLEFASLDSEPGEPSEPKRVYAMSFRGESSIESDEVSEPEGSIEEQIERAFDTYEEGDEAMVLFGQHGQHIPVDEGRVVLDTEPFSIYVISSTERLAMVHIDTDPEVKEAVDEGREVPGTAGAPGYVIPDDPYNENGWIQIDSAGLNAWGMPDTDFHHFDNLELRGDRYVGHRKVRKLRELESRQVTPIEEAGGMTLYFVEFQHVEEPNVERRPPGKTYTVEFRQ